MVKLNKIYTRTGDDGTTGLADGARRSKDDARIIAMGSVDEANAAIGVARLHSASDPALDVLLAQLQNDLFDLGADLATPTDDISWTPLRVTEAQVTALEVALDAYNEPIAALTSFILPAGSPLSAHLHLARTIARRAERDCVGLSRTQAVKSPVLKYLNRLSDLLFVLARHANDRGRADVLWGPSI